MENEGTDIVTVPTAVAQITTTPPMGNEGKPRSHDPTLTPPASPTNDLGRRTLCPSRRPNKGHTKHPNEREHVSASPTTTKLPNDASIPEIIPGHGQGQDPIPTYAAPKPLGTVSDKHTQPIKRTAGNE
jgi:hypothetical protein